MNEIYVFMSARMYCNPFTGVYACVCCHVLGDDHEYVPLLSVVLENTAQECIYKYCWKDVHEYVCHAFGDDHYHVPLLSKAFKWGGPPIPPSLKL